MGLVVSRETQNMGVPYFVDKGFTKEYRGASLEELEKTIETEYIDHLQSSCWKEKQQSESSSPRQLILLLHSYIRGMLSHNITKHVLFMW